MPQRTYETCGKAFTSRKKAERYARNVANASGLRVPVYETTGHDAMAECHSLGVFLLNQVRGAQGAAHQYPAVVGDQSPLPKSIHVKIRSAPSRANHICQGILAYPRNVSAIRA